MSERFFEDFAVGQTFVSPTITVTAERIKAFARDFDPQPFHLDEEAARGSLFGRLVASGWHTAAITMRLIVDSDLRPAGGTIGAGTDELRWPNPVYPGDVLRVEGEVVETRPLRSRAELGLVRMRSTTYNQARQPVQIFTPALMVQKRQP
jgi:acyl dehydratase